MNFFWYIYRRDLILSLGEITYSFNSEVSSYSLELRSSLYSKKKQQCYFHFGEKGFKLNSEIQLYDNNILMRVNPFGKMNTQACLYAV